jgi:hypothetical protein
MRCQGIVRLMSACWQVQRGYGESRWLLLVVGLDAIPRRCVAAVRQGRPLGPIPAILACTWRGRAGSTRYPRSRYCTLHLRALSVSTGPPAGSGRAAGLTPPGSARTISGQRGCSATATGTPLAPDSTAACRNSDAQSVFEKRRRVSVTATAV